MAFWLIASALLVLALGIVLPSLLRGRGEARGSDEVNLAIHRDRLAELQRERDEGRLSEAEFAEARAELEARVLDDLRADPRRPARPARGGAIAVALLLPILTVALYLRFGGEAPSAPPAGAQLPQDPQAQLEFIRANVEQLRRRAETNPDDLEAWLMLGRSYVVLQRYDDAVTALDRARGRFGEQPQLLAELAEALAYRGGGALGGEPLSLIRRALAQNPDHPKALWLAGLAAMQAERPDAAAGHWQRLLGVLPADSGAAAQVRRLLAELRTRPAPAAPVESEATVRLPVSVRLDPALAGQVPADATVFILARAANGPRAPLAVLRRQASELPLEVVLDDTMAMVPGMNLTAFPQVVVEARVSRSGNAASSAGDLLGRSEPLAPGEGGRVELLIDSVVE